MTTRVLRLFLRTAFAASVFTFGTASSCDAGDRASSGACPAGEVCDPSTEDGLHFRGPTIGEGFFDTNDVKTLAVGGRQDVLVFEVDDAGRHLRFELPYEATFDSSAVTVEATRDNLVSLRGTAALDGTLRILSTASGELFDRITVAAQAIAKVTFAPSFSVVLDGGSTDNALYAPGATGYVRLEGAGGSPLVDQDATIAGDGIHQSRWDRFTVGPLAVGSHPITVTAGDRAPVTLALEVAHVDSIVELLGGDLSRTGRSLVCFAARSSGRPIHAAWRFEADGGTVERDVFSGCANVTPGSGDSVVVRAFADGQQASLDLHVAGGSAKPKPRAEPVDALGHPGDRATLR